MHTHERPLKELREELSEMLFRVKHDKRDEYAKDRIKTLRFVIADKCFFARLYVVKAQGKEPTADPLLMRLSARLDKALLGVGCNP